MEYNYLYLEPEDIFRRYIFSNYLTCIVCVTLKTDLISPSFCDNMSLKKEEKTEQNKELDAKNYQEKKTMSTGQWKQKMK